MFEKILKSEQVNTMSNQLQLSKLQPEQKEFSTEQKVRIPQIKQNSSISKLMSKNLYYNKDQNSYSPDKRMLISGSVTEYGQNAS